MPLIRSEAGAVAFYSRIYNRKYAGLFCSQIALPEEFLPPWQIFWTN
jgi:hypothetical protein